MADETKPSPIYYGAHHDFSGPSPADTGETRQNIKGQDVSAWLMVNGARVEGLDPVSIFESKGVAVTTWHVSNVDSLALIEGAGPLVLITEFKMQGQVRRARWLGSFAGIGMAGRTDHVTLTIEGIERRWT